MTEPFTHADFTMPDPVRVLLIDNNQEDNDLIRHWLEQAENTRFTLSRAHGYEAGLAEALSGEVDTCLIDVRLGPRTGLELLRELRGWKCSATLILWTTAGDAHIDRQAMQAGAADTLVKEQAGPALLERVIRHALERKQSEAALQRAREELEQRVYERTAELGEVNAALRAEIEERKRVEAALRASEGRLRRLVESNIIGIVYLDHAGRMTFANEAFLDMVGYSRADLEAGELSWTAMTPPEYANVDARATAEALLRGACSPYEKEFYRKDDIRIPVLVGYALVDEREAGYIGFILDLSTHKHLERELRQRTEQLMEAAHRKDQFLAMLGHELRNPLAPIRNAVQILRVRGTDPTMVQWAAQMAERQVKHMTRLVDDLLDVSRISRGKIRLQRTRFDLAQLVQAEAEDNRPLMAAARLHFDVHIPDHPIWVEADSTRVAQALDNLLHNALKFTDPAGRVTLKIGEENGRAIVTVRDTGIGIEPSMLEHVFETFAQADRSLDRSRGGLGLGLALVKGLVELHGGEVRASSGGPGRGAEFSFLLPMTATVSPASGHSEGGHALGQPLRILLIEDNRDAADSLRVLLQLFGHEVKVAYDGPGGEELARSWRPDLVFSDLGLPGKDGFEVAQDLRADPATAPLRLIALSGYGAPEDRTRCRDVGFEELLTKPVSFEDLQRVLSSRDTMTCAVG